MQEKSLSATDVERRSKGGITQSYVSQIVNRGIESITTKKLDALAKGLGVPRLELYRVAAGGGPEEDAEFRQSAIYMLFEKSKNASPENKQAIDMLIDMLLDRLDRKTGS
jgi:transcriptional regulator with XRE-family HTH domain